MDDRRGALRNRGLIESANRETLRQKRSGQASLGFFGTRGA
jgi:hypothetical protein